MRKAIAIVLTTFAVIVTAAAQGGAVSDQRIEEIRKIYADTNERIAEMEKDPSLSSVFVVELSVNKHSAPYPAVGVFQRTATFYYTYGDREKNPFPDRLLKISAVYRRSAVADSFDYYFNQFGQLVFIFGNENSVESRYYFAAGELIRLTDGNKESNAKSRSTIARGSLMKREAARLMGIFRASLTEIS